jgi:hypothetical protein
MREKQKQNSTQKNVCYDTIPLNKLIFEQHFENSPMQAC